MEHPQAIFGSQSFRQPVPANVKLSHQNHFRFGYDGNWYSPRTSASQKWEVSYGAPRLRGISFRDACLYTARCVAEDAGSKVGILFSGGIDSEVVVRSFLTAGLSLRIFILRFENDLNRHDIEYAESFCRKAAITPTYIDLNVHDFFQSGLGDEYAELSDSVSPQFLVTMWAIDQVDEYTVIGNGDSDIVRRKNWADMYSVEQYTINPLGRDESLDGWDIWEKEKVASWYRHLIFRNRNGCAGFFQYTPEIIAAAVNDPLMQDAYRKNSSNVFSKGQLKQAFYQQHFPHEPRKKYDGFENIRDLDQKYRQKYAQKRPASNAVFRTDIAKFLFPGTK